MLKVHMVPPPISKQITQEYVAQYIILTLIQYIRKHRTWCNAIGWISHWTGTSQLLVGCFSMQRGTVFEKKVGTEMG
jgi:hypothetical protein